MNNKQRLILLCFIIIEVLVSGAGIAMLVVTDMYTTLFKVLILLGGFILLFISTAYIVEFTYKQ